MSGVNKAILIGNLGRDPDLRQTQSGTSVANFSVATSEKFKDRNDQQQERTEWHRIVVWGKTAENCAKYLKKGRKVYVEGKLQTNEWTDKEGVTRKTTEVVAHTVQFLGGGNESSGRSASDEDRYGGDQREERRDPPHDDIPF